MNQSPAIDAAKRQLAAEIGRVEARRSELIRFATNQNVNAAEAVEHIDAALNDARLVMRSNNSALIALSMEDLALIK